MKKLMILTFAIFISLSSICFAQVGLTPEQSAEIQLQIEQMKSKNREEKPAIDPEKVKEWVELGDAVGAAMGSAANKLNIEVENFSKTTVGKTTIFIVVWKLVGREIVKFLSGAGLILLGVPIWWYWFNRLCVWGKTVTKEDGTTEKLSISAIAIESTNSRTLPDHVHGYRILMVLILTAIVIGGMCIILL